MTFFTSIISSVSQPEIHILTASLIGIFVFALISVCVFPTSVCVTWIMDLETGNIYSGVL
jgi:hypothetical protein